jgi:hypothetical protein
MPPAICSLIKAISAAVIKIHQNFNGKPGWSTFELSFEPTCFCGQPPNGGLLGPVATQVPSAWWASASRWAKTWKNHCRASRGTAPGAEPGENWHMIFVCIHDYDYDNYLYIYIYIFFIHIIFKYIYIFTYIYISQNWFAHVWIFIFNIPGDCM